MLDAIAQAFGREVARPCGARRWRRATSARSALAARGGGLEDIAIRYGAPIGFMLATPMTFGSSYRELAAGTWLVEDKYDGIRAQGHIRGNTARIFSRTLNDISRSFPEVVAALAACPHDAILDGEIVARRGEADLAVPVCCSRACSAPIRTPRCKRRLLPCSSSRSTWLAAGDRFLLDEPLVERRTEVAALVARSPALVVAPWHTLEPGASPETIAELFDAARARGNEGLMLKRTDAPYVPGPPRQVVAQTQARALHARRRRRGGRVGSRETQERALGLHVRRARVGRRCGR